MEREVRVRFAPSPTGPLHIGGVRTALYNYLFARGHNGKFILRIEDTDQARYVEGAEKYIHEALSWLGISPDEGPFAGGPFEPYRQSERGDLYREYAEQMVKEGTAYYAFDTPEELEEMREKMKKAGVPNPKYDHVTREYMKNSLSLSLDEAGKRLAEGQPYVIRVKIPRKEEVKLKDVIRGWVTVQSNQLDDKVLFKSDGMPTYHLANVVDDYLMKITHVIRGEEWLPSAPLHVLLYRYLGWEHLMPEFAHLPLILKPDGLGKLSKRDGDTGGFPVFPLEWEHPESGEKASGYREAGYSPEAVLNILAMLGWNPGDKREIFTLAELVEAFSLEKVSKSGAKFDPEKAKWYNQQHLRQQSDDILANIFMETLQEKGIEADAAHVAAVCGLIKEKASFISDFWSLGHYFFIPPDSYDESLLAKKWDDTAPAFFEKLLENLQHATDFDSHHVEETFKATAEEMEVKPGNYMPVFRMLLSGVTSGPAIYEMAAILGKEDVTARISHALKSINSNV